MTRYLKNAWYQAGWTNEIESGLLSRILLGQRLLFWRKTDGSVVAMEDRCPHRFAPLSRGVLQDDIVTCLYHGLAFNAEGKCLHGFMPEAVPSHIQVRTFPVAERNAILWYWPGDPGLADTSLIPDFSFLDEMPGFERHLGYEYVKANYQLIVDNLMDTTHMELVHRPSFARPGVVPKGHFNVDREGDMLHNNFWVREMTAEQVWPEPVPDAESYDRWIDMRWHAPSTMRLNVGTAPHGTVPEKGSHVDFPGILQSHIITPETETTSHYFWALQDRLVGERAADAKLAPLIKQAFSAEDRPMLEAVQDNMRSADFWAEQPAILKTDLGAVMARRIVDSLMRGEQSDESAGPEKETTSLVSA